MLREKRKKLDCGLQSPATAKKLPSSYVWAGTGNAEACQKLITARKPPQQGCTRMPGHGRGEKAEPLAQQHGHNEQENAHSCIHITVTTMCFCLLFSCLVLLEALFWTAAVEDVYSLCLSWLVHSAREKIHAY